MIGCDTDLRDNDGATAIEYVRSNEMLRVFQSYGTERVMVISQRIVKAIVKREMIMPAI
jgi:hypothetical protein